LATALLIPRYLQQCDWMRTSDTKVKVIGEGRVQLLMEVTTANTITRCLDGLNMRVELTCTRHVASHIFWGEFFFWGQRTNLGKLSL